ncbi:MAG: IPT/TIG domain-containing protein [Planctomycetes bacterium]|nr:IPT/TIG domain-containing protein [Planctomycetota bacterium]
MSAQQPNSPVATLTIDGRDDGDYPIQVVTTHPGFATFAVGGTPGEAYAIFGGQLALPGLDLGTAGRFEIFPVPGITPIINGIAPQNPLDFLAVLPGSGILQAVFATPAPRFNLALQAVVNDPTNPLGITLSATTQWRVYDGVATELSFPAEDSSVFHALSGGGISVFGVNHTGFHVNSNGNISFGVADSSDQASAAALESGPPRVAMAWRDLDPTTKGQVVVFEAPSGAVFVDWFRVPIGDGAGGLLTERLTGVIGFEANGDTWTRVDQGAPGLQVSGFSPGPSGTPGYRTNFSTGLPVTHSDLAATSDVYSTTKPYDLDRVFVRRHAPDGQGNVTLDTGFVPLQVTRIVPAIGPQAGLASVHLRGTGFGAGVQVFIGGALSPTIDIVSADEIVVRTPPGGLGLADVVVFRPGIGSVVLPNAYTYVVNQPVAFSGPMSPGQSAYFPFPLGFVFPFYDEWYEGVWVNANGSLSFGAADATFPATGTLMDSGPPRMAMLLGDWQWGPASVVAVHCTPYFCTLGFVNLLTPGTATPHSFQVVLSHHGEMFLNHLVPPPSGIDLIVGVSAGDLGLGSGAVDLSATSSPTSPFAPAWERFNAANPFDLGGLRLDLLPAQVVAPFFSVSVHP